MNKKIFLLKCVLLLCLISGVGFKFQARDPIINVTWKYYKIKVPENWKDSS
jgi:hypothetical protein